MHHYGGRGGPPGYGQHMAPPQRPTPYPPQAPMWRPGMPPPPAAGYMQAAGYGQAPGMVPRPPAPRVPAPPAVTGAMNARGGPPRREMDSLLEEMKAKQRMQQERKAQIMKEADSGESSPPPGETSVYGSSQPAKAFVAAPPAAGSSAPGLQAAAPDPGLAGGQWGAGGASAAVDELSSLLLLRELPSSVNEDVICQLFSRYGIVTAVDIVTLKDNGQIQGYVMMDTRENALRAKEALHDREVEGVPLWIEWARRHAPQAELVQNGTHTVVQIPRDDKKRRIIDRMARYVAQEGHNFEQIVMERESPEGNFGFLFQHDSPDNIYYRWRTFAFSQNDNVKVWRTETFRLCEGGRWWRAPACEAAVQAAKKKENSKFSSGAAKDKSSSSTAAPVLEEPPNPATAVKQSGPVSMPAHWTQEDIEEEKERQRLEEKATQERQKRDRDKRGIAGGQKLSDADWDALETLLRNVTGARCKILETMVFCMDKCDCAIEIAEFITESLTIVQTELPLKMSRLMVVSDILHNTASSRPAAWAYRREFEKSLPDIFEQFEIGFQFIESKLAISSAREQAKGILKVWEDWGLFAPQYLRGLEAALMIGVRSLRLLANKGDNSREPAWLEPKLSDWRRQHFSQLEKMCRTRGLRCSTSHLEPSKQLSMEQVRRDWLIDHLVAYELLAHEKEQARLAAAKEDAASKAARRKAKYGIQDDEEECGMDGYLFDEAEIDGEPLDFATPGELLQAVELAKQTPEALAGYLGAVGAAGASDVLGTGDSPYVLGLDVSSVGSEEASGVFSKDSGIDGIPVNAAVAHDEEEEADTEVSGQAAEPREVDPTLLRDIELEVMELRASLQLQGTHRDAIEDICNKKKQEMIEEHEAKKGGRKKAPVMKKEDDKWAKEKEEEKEKERQKEKEQERQRQKEKEREKATVDGCPVYPLKSINLQ